MNTHDLICPECGGRFHLDAVDAVDLDAVMCPSCRRMRKITVYSLVSDCPYCGGELSIPVNRSPEDRFCCPHCGKEFLPQAGFPGAPDEADVPAQRILEDGAIFEKYRIIRLLGRGGMAEVYLAEHLLLRRRCALKLMIEKKNVVYQKRFLREARCVRDLSHPNIVRVFDAGCDAATGRLFIAMEYVDGTPLSDIAGTKLPEQDLLNVARDMAHALEALEAIHVVHRDIKPSNIIRDKNGVFKLMDLGIAKTAHDESEEQYTLTVERTIFGTPSYASPEQCRDSHRVDTRSDIYSLGATLYHLASGRCPYHGATAMETILKVLETEPEPLTKLRRDLSRPMQLLISKMLWKDPARRPQNAEELEKLIADVREGKWRGKSGRSGFMKYMLAVDFLLLALLLLALSIWKIAKNRFTPRQTVRYSRNVPTPRDEFIDTMLRNFSDDFSTLWVRPQVSGWSPSVGAALMRSIAENKNILIVLSASEPAFMRDPEFVEFAEKQIPVFIRTDTTRMPESQIQHNRAVEKFFFSPARNTGSVQDGIVMIDRDLFRRGMISGKIDYPVRQLIERLDNPSNIIHAAHLANERTNRLKTLLQNTAQVADSSAWLKPPAALWRVHLAEALQEAQRDKKLVLVLSGRNELEQENVDTPGFLELCSREFVPVALLRNLPSEPKTQTEYSIELLRALTWFHRLTIDAFVVAPDGSIVTAVPRAAFNVPGCRLPILKMTAEYYRNHGEERRKSEDRERLAREAQQRRREEFARREAELRRIQEERRRSAATRTEGTAVAEKSGSALTVPPLPAAVKEMTGTLEERIERAEKRLRELQTELRSGGAPSAREVLNKKIAVRYEQLRRLKAQVAVRERARHLDRSKFDAAKMEEFKRKFAEYTRQHTDWGYGFRDIEFTNKLIEELKTGTIDPNIDVVDSTYPRYSGPLIKCIASGRIHQADKIAKQLIELGVDTTCMEHDDNMRYEVWPVVLTEGGFNALTGCLLPFLKRQTIPFDVVESILYLNHRVDERDELGNSVLHYAVRSGSSKLVSLLLLLDADVNARNNRGETPLFEATKNSHLAICDMLVRAGADRNIKDNDGKTAANMAVVGKFRTAVTNGQLGVVAELLKKGVDPDTRFGDGYTALQTACRKKNLMLVKLLLDSGANPDLGCEQGRAYYPLQLAFERDNVSPAIFALLLKEGANPNIPPVGYGGTTLLRHLCEGYGSPGGKDEEILLDALLDNPRTDLYVRYSGSEISVLSIALRSKRSSRFVRKLVGKLKSLESWDPVVAAAVEGGYSESLIRELIEKGADVNLPATRYTYVREDGRNRRIEYTTTALFAAVEGKKLNIVRLLLAHGADKNWKNAEGKTVRDLDTSPQIRALLR